MSDRGKFELVRSRLWTWCASDKGACGLGSFSIERALFLAFNAKLFSPSHTGWEADTSGLNAAIAGKLVIHNTGSRSPWVATQSSHHTPHPILPHVGPKNGSFWFCFSIKSRHFSRYQRLGFMYMTQIFLWPIHIFFSNNPVRIRAKYWYLSTCSIYMYLRSSTRDVPGLG